MRRASGKRDGGATAGGRGQSSGVALAVLLGLVVVMAAVTVFFLVVSGGGDGPPEADLSVEVTAESVTVSHEGGDTLDPAEIAVTLVVDGEQSEQLLVTFGNSPDDSEQFAPGEQFEHEGGPYTGEVTVLVVHEPTETQLADETVTVEDGTDSELAVTVDEVTDSEGDALFVGDEASVTFTLDSQTGAAERTVAVQFDGEVVFEESIAVDAGGTVTETVTAGADLADGLDVEVNAGEEEAVETLAAPSFTVDVGVETGNPSVAVDYTVENTGEVGDERELTFESTAANGTVLDARTGSERVAGGETATGTFTDVTAEASGTLALSAGDGAASVDIGESDFQVVDLDAPDTVEAGTAFDVAYEIENQGAFADTQNVGFLVDGVVQAVEADVTLTAGETVDGTFTYEVGAEETPSVTVAVDSADDSREQEVAVDSPTEAAFAVDIVETNAPVQAGTDLTVTASVENTGEQEGTQTLALEVAELGGDETERTLGAGESTEVTLSVATEATAAGEYTATVASADDEDAVAVEIAEAPDPEAVFEVVEFDAPGTVDAGETLTVTYEVENTGDGAGTQTVEFVVDGNTEAVAEDIDLGAGETFGDAFSFEASDAGGETLAVSVSTDDDSASADVQVVEETDDGDLVATLGQAEGEVGETITVDLDVTSVASQGDPFGSYTLVFTFDDSVLDFQGVAGGAWAPPASVNDEGDAVAVADFDVPGETPSEPALTLEFDLVGAGSSDIAFDDVGDIPGENQINDENGDEYDVVFQDGAAEAT